MNSLPASLLPPPFANPTQTLPEGGKGAALSIGRAVVAIKPVPPKPAATQAHRIRFISGPEVPPPVPVGSGTLELTVGREAGVVVTDKRVSRKHVMLQRVDGSEWRITDLSSAGTVVDGKKIKPRVPTKLKRGSVVKLGSGELSPCCVCVGLWVCRR